MHGFSSFLQEWQQDVFELYGFLGVHVYKVEEHSQSLWFEDVQANTRVHKEDNLPLELVRGLGIDLGRPKASLKVVFHVGEGMSFRRNQITQFCPFRLTVRK